MKSSFLVQASIIVLFLFSFAQAQSSIPAQNPDDRTRTVNQLPAQTAAPPRKSIVVAPDPGAAKEPPVDVGKTTHENRVVGPTATERHVESPTSLARVLTPPAIQARIGEAERLLKSRPTPTALTVPAIDLVTLAALDRPNARIHLVTLFKDTFLTKGAEVTMTSSLGAPLTIRIIRANGVNTAVAIFDSQGQSLVPLVVQYPIERGGVFREMAYYTSVHPALFSPELGHAGQAYVHNMIELAVKRLREKGVFISPQIVDVAERLCIVEHVDHDRFKLENRLALFQEIYSLFALNDLDTYRYSVSSAGAGGMVQMIPWAYNLVKQRHPGVGLVPDFVTGMRNHVNALQAMLLYMQDTWNDLAANEDVQYALSAKLATQTELLAAGYNSNAARLPQYIRRGGYSWRVLIPRETQMYLQIYKTFEGLVPLKQRVNQPLRSLAPAVPAG
jgi:hypothetical protein